MTAPTEDIQEVQEQTQTESPTILRTRRSGVWEIYQGAWGSYLRETDDPNANVEIDDEHLKEFQVRENIHRIPAELWARWVKLCFYFVDKVPNTVEVSVRILRNSEDPSQYRFLVPLQKVSAASVRAEDFDLSIDLETGEEITQYPPDGWIPVGSSHSHNTMDSFFSEVDDKYELNDPGIHLVVGSIDTKNMKYTIASSVVGSHRRFDVPFDKLIDATPVSGVEFHPNVINYVDYTKPTYKYPVTKVANTTTKTTWSNPKTWGWDQDDYNYGGYRDWENDPFFWTDDTNVVKSSINSWNVVDVLNDYIEENKEEPLNLLSMRDKLQDIIDGIDLYIDAQPDSVLLTELV